MPSSTSNDLGVYITLYNDENFIVPCVEAIKKVFPSVEVLDLGSQDNSVALAKKLTVVRDCRDARHVIKYPEFKNEIAKNHKFIFWIDADEVYPETELLKIKEIVYTSPFVVGGWKFINKDKKGQLLITEEILNKGRICWNTKDFYVGGTYPREKLRTRLPSFPPQQNSDPSVFCYHAMLLQRSSMREDSGRHKKRQHRLDTLNTLNVTWSLIKTLPWEK